MTESGLSPGSEELLVSQIQAARKGRRLAALLLLVICLAGGATLGLGYDLRDPATARGAAGATVGTLLALVLLATTLGDPRRNRTVETLRSGADAVVWVYVKQPPRPAWTEKAWARSLPGIVADSTLVTCLRDGRCMQLAVRAGSEQAVIDAVKVVVPQAAAGYSPAREAQFKRDPASLGRSTP